MTRVCVLCGWLVLEGERCRRDGGPAINAGAAARACRVGTLRELLNLEPPQRVTRFRLAVESLRAARA